MPQNKKHIYPAMVFPPLQLFASMILLEEITMDVHEHYIKKTYRNRYDILGPNGVHTLSIPLAKGKNAQLPMHEVQIFNMHNWQQRHFKSIVAAYGKSPYFDFYIEKIQTVFHTKFTFLVDFNMASIQVILDCLAISSRLNKTDRYYTPNEIQEGQWRTMRHATRMKSKCFTDLHKYVQVFSDRFEFESNLSILDLIFCMGPATISFLKSMKLIKKLDTPS